jgi:hypothetical protein
MFSLSSDVQLSSKPPILPSNQSPLGALPARFRRSRVLIVGCGDVGQRVAQALPRPVRLLALTSSPERLALLRPGHHARWSATWTGRPRCAGWPAWPRGCCIWRRRRARAGRSAHHGLLRALRRRNAPTGLVYGSTSGVYGDCAGALVDETRAPSPHTERARRRVDAERAVRFWAGRLGARQHPAHSGHLRARPRRHTRGPPAKRHAGAGREDDVYTNHIHANDLARACVAALWRGRPQRIYNASDDTELLMGDYFDLAADMHGLPGRHACRATRRRASCR